ncbi:glycosyltransferase family 4 protein [Roseovarius sp. SYSU LYC5161]|uniref:glycosyltransferase family 4 protein n=1 Tax=Roseovarius halophilus (ex Wu et al. 2025) TaxID=3376060 RepID=UPI003999626F
MTDTGRPDEIEVIAPNIKRRLSGVTATIARLMPLQAGIIGIRATGPGLPEGVPRIPLWRCLFLPRTRDGRPVWRVWHARRNIEMLAGLVLRGLFRRRLQLVFTSASQRRHTGWTRMLIGRMDAVIATSQATEKYLTVPATVILHGIDTNRLTPAADRAALRARLGLPQQARIAGCIGRIRAQKGTDVFVDAMITVARGRPDVVGVVLGRATAKHRNFLAEQKKKVALAGLSDRILFPDEVPVDQVADWYAALDLFIAPQRWEGFGLTPLEAMACGVPVIATTVGAFPELLVPGTTGTLIAPGDVRQLAEAAAAYLDDDDRLARDGATGRAHVLNRFRIEDEAREIVGVYRRLLEQA